MDQFVQEKIKKMNNRDQESIAIYNVVEKNLPQFGAEATTKKLNFKEMLQSYSKYYFNYTLHSQSEWNKEKIDLFNHFKENIDVNLLNRLLKDEVFETFLVGCKKNHINAKEMIDLITNINSLPKDFVHTSYLQNQTIFKKLYDIMALTDKNKEENVSTYHIIMKLHNNSKNLEANQAITEASKECIEPLRGKVEQNRLEAIITDPRIKCMIKELLKEHLHPEILVNLILNPEIAYLSETPLRTQEIPNLKLNLEEDQEKTLYNTAIGSAYRRPETRLYHRQLEDQLEQNQEQLERSQMEIAQLKDELNEMKIMFRQMNTKKVEITENNAISPYKYQQETNQWGQTPRASSTQYHENITPSWHTAIQMPPKNLGQNASTPGYVPLKQEYESTLFKVPTMQSNTTSNATSTIKALSIRDALSSIPMFDGIDPPFRLFAAGCRNALNIFPNNEQEIVRSIGMRLKGGAAKAAIGYEFRSMAQVISFFEKRYDKIKTYFDLTGELAAVKQGKDSVIDFSNKITEIAESILKIAERENRTTADSRNQLQIDVIKYFIRGLRPEIQMRTYMSSDYNEVLERALEVEKELGPIETPKTKVLAITQEEIEECQVCKKEGHTAKECATVKEKLKEKERRNKPCQICDKTNHSAENCFEYIGFPPKTRNNASNQGVNFNGSNSNGNNNNYRNNNNFNNGNNNNHNNQNNNQNNNYNNPRNNNYNNRNNNYNNPSNNGYNNNYNNRNNYQGNNSYNNRNNNGNGNNNNYRNNNNYSNGGSNNSNGNYNNQNNQTTCQICRRTGHIAAFCQYRLATQDSGGSENNRPYCEVHLTYGHSTQNCNLKRRQEQAKNENGSSAQGAAQMNPSTSQTQ